ncbi:MAG: hypothetical protein HC853_02540 [Anaerolineae bacterium]|nr:hypothetical protein [Anaerolineae bacterium]
MHTKNLIGLMLTAQVLLSACATQQTVIVVTATPDAAPQPTPTERVIVVTATPIPPTPDRTRDCGDRHARDRGPAADSN